jgi:hypothetical protein
MTTMTTMQTLIQRLSEATERKHTYKHRVSRNGGVTVYADQEDAGPYAVAMSGIGTPFTFGDRDPQVAVPGTVAQRSAFYQAQAVQQVAVMLWPGGQDDGLTATVMGTLVRLAKKVFKASDDTGYKSSPDLERRLLAAAQQAGLGAADEDA